MGPLGEVWSKHLPRPALASGLDPAALEAALARLLDAARGACPGVADDAEPFLRHLAERFDADDEPLRALDALRAGDLLLAFGCLRGDASALAAFEAQYLGAVPRLLGQAGYTDAPLVDEVQQQLREKLLVGSPHKAPDLAAYSGRGPLLSWVRMAALRAAINQRVKEKKYVPTAEPPSDDAVLGSDPELGYIKARYRDEFRAAFREAFEALGAEERNLLSFYLVDRLNIAEIGALFGKHRATIARWIAQTREKILADVHRGLERRLKVGGSEMPA